jgi:hypothetical protein
LVEKRGGDRRIRLAHESAGDVVEVGGHGGAHVRAEVADDSRLVAGGDDLENRDVDGCQHPTVERQLESPPERHGVGTPTDDERPVDAQVGVHGAPVVEADQQVLARGIGPDEHGVREVDADESRITGDASQDPLPGEAPIDPICQAPNRVTLCHGFSVTRAASTAVTGPRPR